MRNILFIFAIFFFSCNTNNLYLPKPKYGKIIRYSNFKSEFISERNIDVWLPENFSKTKKYAVIYMHDGQMLFDSTITWNKQEWQVDECLSNLNETKKIKECIVVGMWNNPEKRFQEYFPQNAMEMLDTNQIKTLFNIPTTIPIYSNNYLKFIINELKPTIDKDFPTLTDPNNTYIMGSSMGGLISIYAVCEYPNIFGGAACLSTHWTGATAHNNVIPSALKKYLGDKLPSPSNHKFYFDYGTLTLDSLYKQYQLSVDSILIKKGFSSKNWITLEYNGADHSEKSWAKRLYIPIEFLLSNQENR